MKYSEKMTRNGCLAVLTILLLLIKSSGGDIISTSPGLPTCKGSWLQGTDLDKSGILSFRYPGAFFCRWIVEKPKDAGEAVVLRVKKIAFRGCTSKLQLPGMAKICTRTEPFCHVYTSSDSYCTQSDINRQVQASYSDCTTSQIYSGVTTMELDYSPAGDNVKAFKIDFMKITCNEPATTTSSATTAEIFTTNKAPKVNLGDDMIRAGQPVPINSTKYPIASKANTTKASETTRATSNSMETGSGSTGTGFSVIVTSASSISSSTDDADNVTNMFTTGTHVTPGNTTADTEQTLRGHTGSNVHLNLAAILVPILVIIVAVGCGVMYFIWKRYSKKEELSNN